MRKRITREMRDFWWAFGCNRFTKSNLWRAFQGQYYHAGGQEPWPRDDFMAWLDLSGKKWVVPEPGPRGGEGWRLSDDLIQAFDAEDARIQDLNELAESSVEAVDVTLGTLNVLPGGRGTGKVPRIMWAFMSDVEIPGPNVDGRSRPDPLSVFVFVAPADIKPGALEAKVRRSERHVRDLIEKRSAALLDEVERLDSMLR